MESRTRKHIEKLRGRIEELRDELESLLKDSNLKPEGNGAFSERVREETLTDPRALRAFQQYRQRQREYALYRLKEGLGGDPMYLEPGVFISTLREVIGRSKIAALADELQPMKLESQTRNEMLATPFSFAEAIPRSIQKSDLLTLLSERSPMKDAFRRWANKINDPFIRNTLDKLRQLAENFEHSQEQLRRRLDTLRRKYEAEKGRSDHIELVFTGSVPQLRVSNDWSSLAAALPRDVEEVYALFLSIERQLEEIESEKRALNAEMRRFLSTLVPLYLAYVEQQSKAARQIALGSVKPSVRVAEQMMKEARQTDYLLPGDGLKVPHLKVAKDLAGVRKLSGYKAYRRASDTEDLRTADTREFPTNR